jgi:hypothetical protein
MEYLSLYDYLKRPSGEQLGLEVAKAAINRNIPIQTKEISNPKYTGKVNLYPKDFLDSYFKKPESIHIDDLENELDDLPF